MRRLDHPQGRPEPGAGRQRPGVAVVQHLRAGREEPGAVGCELVVSAIVVGNQGMRALQHRGRARLGVSAMRLGGCPNDPGGPAQIHRRGTGPRDVLDHPVEVVRKRAVRLRVVAMRAEGHAIGPPPPRAPARREWQACEWPP